MNKIDNPLRLIEKKEETKLSTSRMKEGILLYNL